MGFSGKPSKACEACRRRRTRCSQCHRKDISCNYRDLIDLAFRHENDTVVRKAQQSHLRPWSVPSKHDLSKPGKIPDLVWNSRVGRVRAEDAATAFFMSKFAYGIYHDYVPALYRSKDCSPALKSSVEAVGLATLSLARSESSLLEYARECHMSAVRDIQVSLNSPTMASRADTLAAIMLLALFAGMTCEPTAARINWTRHVKGALALMNTHPKTEENDPVVNILSSHVTGCVLVDCLQSVVEPPKQFQEIKFEPRIPVNFQEKSEYVLTILAEVRNENISIKNALATIERLDDADGHLDDLLAFLPKKHPRTIVSTGVGLDEPVYHIYPHHSSARVWNIIRLTRLSSFELRYDKMRDLRRLEATSLQPLNIDIEQQEEYATTSAQLMIHDICASIPKCLRSPDYSSGQNLINWAHSLLWPLSAARASPHAPGYLRLYMKHQLQNLWDVTKFPVVDYHKKNLDEETDPHIWTHVFFMM